MHAPGHIREAFCDWMENVSIGTATLTDATTQLDDMEYQIDRLLGRLWNCTDTVPSADWSLVQMPPNSNGTYAAMVRHIKAEYRNPN